jgi:M6 family metalloprotease-like protein
LFCTGCFALEPPDTAEIEALSRSGKLSERQRAAEVLGNHRFKPELVEKAKRKLQKVKNDYLGIVQPEAETFAPPPAWQGLQTTGDVKLLALLIAFPDYPPSNTQDFIDSNLFGYGNPANYPYENLAAYYARSSYNLLTITGNTLGWYTTAYPRSQVPETILGRENLIKEALNYYNSLGHDFTQYDNDGDGDIDYLIVIWTGPDNGWANFWWGYYTGFSDASYTIDGKTIDRISWQWESRPVGGTFSPLVVIHETGHALGVPDYYDYDSSVGPQGGVGGLDMMHGNKGDHNCFSKWMLDWITPVYVPLCGAALSLRASGEYPDAVMVFPGAGSDDLFSEYFMVQNRYRAGNDDTPEMPGNGLIIWHVDATLNSWGTDFQYDNSFTEHKLLRLMEADGLEEIEAAGAADAGDYYIGGDEFGPATIPSSSLYSGAVSDVRVANISAVSSLMTASAGASAVCWFADGSDLAVLIADYGRVGCSGGCHWDFDADGDVDEDDLAYFALVFGTPN